MFRRYIQKWNFTQNLLPHQRLLKITTTVPTIETDTTPVTTNNTVDNEPAEIQNKIQDNNEIRSKMTPTDHTKSATALRSADAVNPNMRTSQKSNDTNIFNVSKEIFNCSTYCITKLTLHNANLLHQSHISSISFSVLNFCVIIFLLESTVTIYTDKIFGFSQHLLCVWESNIRAIDGR